MKRKKSGNRVKKSKKMPQFKNPPLSPGKTWFKIAPVPPLSKKKVCLNPLIGCVARRPTSETIFFWKTRCFVKFPPLLKKEKKLFKVPPGKKKLGI